MRNIVEKELKEKSTSYNHCFFSPQKLYMVFEYLDKDLKRYMDDFEATPNCPGLPEKLVKVRKPLSRLWTYRLDQGFGHVELGMLIWYYAWANLPNEPAITKMYLIFKGVKIVLRAIILLLLSRLSLNILSTLYDMINLTFLKFVCVYLFENLHH